MYSINVEDRDYSEWIIEPPLYGSSYINPVNSKLFHGDLFDLDENQKCTIVQSPLRENQNIPGILILEKNRSYGRTENKKRLLYRCKPFNTCYPHFLIPYEIPMGFNKNFRNKYVTFRLDHWEGKHPQGLLSQTIGLCKFLQKSWYS